jgi:hypothetical protein
MSPSEYIIAHPDAIPPELKILQHWVNWDPELVDDRWTKVLKNARTRNRASSTNPDTWSTFDRTLKTNPDRIGFVLTGSGFTVIDLDHCRDPDTGVIAEWAWVVIRTMNSYTEASVSGSGIHILARGQLPPGRRRIGQIETYDSGRYITMTGAVVDGYNAIRDDDGILAAWHADTFPAKAPTAPPTPTVECRLDDDVLLKRIRNSKNGAAFIDLFDHEDASKYGGNKSSRDFALMSYLRFWTQGDTDQMERLFSQSTPGKREKWRTRADYRQKTIENALDGDHRDPNHGQTTARLTIVPTPPPVFEPGDPCADVRAELEAARETIRQLQRDKSMLMALLLNPHVAAADKTAVAATLDKVTRKQPGEDGLVTLKPGEIANDWRPRAKPGENTDPLNRDGSKPYMNRSAVKRTMTHLKDQKFIDARPGTRQVEPKGREPYQETVWLVKPPDSVADFLAPIALFTPAEATPRKPRTITPQCPTCHIDLQGVTIQTVTIIEGVCPACGEVHRDESPAKPRTVEPIITIDPNARAAEHVDHLSTVRSVVTPTVDHLSTRSAPPVDTEPLLNAARPEPTGPPPNWEDGHRRVYGQVYRGEAAS